MNDTIEAIGFLIFFVLLISLIFGAKKWMKDD
jgi:hypothetical protein